MSLSSLYATILSGARALTRLAPVVLTVFLGLPAVRVPLGALSLKGGGNLGFGTFVVGSVIGRRQSLTTRLTRHQAATFCDQRGPLMAIRIGLSLATALGAAYVFSGVLPVSVAGKLVLIAAGRLSMGLGESLFPTGSMSLGIARFLPRLSGHASPCGPCCAARSARPGGREFRDLRRHHARRHRNHRRACNAMDRHSRGLDRRPSGTPGGTPPAPGDRD